MASPESTPVSFILKQRQQSQSTKFAPKPGEAGGVNQTLLPPLYPSAPLPSVLSSEFANSVKVYNKLCQHFVSNFSVEGVTKRRGGISVERYTDRYKSQFALKEHLLHILPDSRLPDELTTKYVAHKTVTRKVKRKIEDLPDADETSAEKNAPINKKEPESEDEDKDDANVEDMDEYEDDVDDEMDVGTDYTLSYFDNGEGDDDDQDADEGAIY